MRALLPALLAMSLLACGPDSLAQEEVDELATDEAALTGTTVTPANDRDAIAGLVKVIDSAKVRLDVIQYEYLFDRAGLAPVNQAFQRATARGVKLNVLLDNGPAENATTATRLRALGATVKVDAAGTVTHNKLVLADAKMFFTGSANFSSESLNTNHEVNAVVSSSILGGKLRAYFDVLWADSTAAATITNAASATQQVLADAQYGASALAAINAAKTRVRLVMYSTRYGANQTPPIRDQLLTALRAAGTRGVDVKVVLESSSSAWDKSVSDANRATGTWLRAGGVDVRYDPPTVRTHAKLLVADSVVYLGSTNWTSAALEEYHATDLRLKGVTISGKYAAYFDQQWATATP